MLSVSQILKQLAPKDASTPVNPRPRSCYRYDDSSDEEQTITDPRKIAKRPSRKKARYDPYQVQNYRNGEVIQNRPQWRNVDAETHLLSNVRNTLTSRNGELFEENVLTYTLPIAVWGVEPEPESDFNTIEVQEPEMTQEPQLHPDFQISSPDGSSQTTPPNEADTGAKNIPSPSNDASSDIDSSTASKVQKVVSHSPISKNSLPVKKPCRANVSWNAWITFLQSVNIRYMTIFGR